MFLDVVSSALLLARAAALVDAYFSSSDIVVFWALVSAIVCVWITIPEDMGYRGKPSRVIEILSIADFKAATNKNSLVCFLDPASCACAEYAIVHAEISACNEEVEFYIVNHKKFPEIAKAANVSADRQPVIVKYMNGRESARLPSQTPKASMPVKGGMNESLERRFWYHAVKSYFSL